MFGGQGIVAFRPSRARIVDREDDGNAEGFQPRQGFGIDQVDVEDVEPERHHRSDEECEPSLFAFRMFVEKARAGRCRQDATLAAIDNERHDEESLGP